MVASSSPRGLIIDLITPLRSSGDIDGRGLERHLDRVLPHVQALYLASPVLGEGKNLNAAQREELLEKTLVVARGQIPILVWISQRTEEATGETLLLLEKRLKKGRYTGPVFWVDSPLYYHSNRGLFLHYQNLSAAVKGRYLLHNDPALIKELAQPLKRRNIRTSILKDLAQISAIQGLIFSGSLDRARNYQKAVRARTDFRIYDEDESHFLTYPSLSGVVSAGANLAPRAWQKITASSLNLSGNRQDYPDHLRQIWETGEHLQTLMETYRPIPAAIIKRILSDLGIIESPTCTFETQDVTERTETLRALMERYGDYR